MPGQAVRAVAGLEDLSFCCALAADELGTKPERWISVVRRDEFLHKLFTWGESFSFSFSFSFLPDWSNLIA